ncbi:hypothetical protein C2E25_09540 [Geothermobacter hydrogeniphilus]|uniref:Response regulatory domain-containing protein n=1 Tax=Geothermobacter hydrogeniphilus TaxID=1969733 RepID=A0A2K2H9V7_9BACT|nr:response regulator [Geothermobacter hydrogeniphilus]PNU20020.1 hypothetical protein C2E25_09540 [Geothermobacter hydrogeniphilus]
MSLVGNLEDLGLGDILQIVSLSRKSGVLTLSSRGREGKVIFYNGQVIRATSSVYRENLGHLLLRKELVDLDTLRRALELQAGSTERERLGTILSEQFGISRDAIEEVVKEQVEKIVYSFFAWTEGAFSFELGEQEDPAQVHVNPLQFMLDQGLNPQWLAMEGSRIIDEKRHRGEDPEETPIEPVTDLEELLGDLVAVNEEAGGAESELPLDEGDLLLAPTGDEKQPILLVDDDELTRDLLAEALAERGRNVRSFADGRAFLKALEEVAGKGGRPVLVVDLIMPRMDGSGILGGLELADRIADICPEAKAYVLTDHPNQDAEKKLREKGFPAVLAKPKKDALRSGDGTRELQILADRIIAGDGAGESVVERPPSGDYHNIGRELIAELGDDAGLSSSKGPESPGLHLLKGMLQELNNPSLGGGIILLVLRFASELMNRAVIFLVKDDIVVGLGQFGIELKSSSADLNVRRIAIPRQESSVLASALKMMTPLKAEPGETEWDRYLQEQLGGGRPAEIFLGPILSEGKVVALLYGDNLPEKTPIGDTESLEIFLSQAGLAMEKALLERRLKLQDV